jgi:hypothetical protein
MTKDTATILITVIAIFLFILSPPFLGYKQQQLQGTVSNTVLFHDLYNVTATVANCYYQ